MFVVKHGVAGFVRFGIGQQALRPEQKVRRVLRGFFHDDYIN